MIINNSLSETSLYYDTGICNDWRKSSMPLRYSRQSIIRCMIDVAYQNFKTGVIVPGIYRELLIVYFYNFYIVDKKVQNSFACIIWLIARNEREFFNDPHSFLNGTTIAINPSIIRNSLQQLLSNDLNFYAKIPAPREESPKPECEGNRDIRASQYKFIKIQCFGWLFVHHHKFSSWRYLTDTWIIPRLSSSEKCW